MQTLDMLKQGAGFLFDLAENQKLRHLHLELMNLSTGPATRAYRAATDPAISDEAWQAAGWDQVAVYALAVYSGRTFCTSTALSRMRASRHGQPPVKDVSLLQMSAQLRRVLD